jgi:hypothetical protein
LGRRKTACLLQISKWVLAWGLRTTTVVREEPSQAVGMDRARLESLKVANGASTIANMRRI